MAKRVPSTRTHHGDTVIDEYAWLQDKDSVDTIAYLKAENAYTEARTADQAPLREKIFAEIKERTQETDLSVPVRKGAWWYYVRTEEGKQYAIHCRVAAAPGETEPPAIDSGAPVPGEQIIIDENLLAGDSEFFALGTYDVSPDGRLVAYSTDYSGDERFTLRVKDLDTGETRPDEIPHVFYGSAWSTDASALFYLTVDDAWRPHQVWRHTIGTPTGTDQVIFTESDERFWAGVTLTRSERYILIESHSKITSEVRYLPADDPTADPVVFGPGRREGVELYVDHQGDRFWILDNEGAENFKLSTAPADDPGRLTTVIPHRADTRLLEVDAFADHVVVHFRRDGLTGLRILPDGGAPGPVTGDPHPGHPHDPGIGEPRDIVFPEPVYTVEPHVNPDYRAASYRLRYVSLVTPDSIYDCDAATGALTLRKRKPVLGGYNPDDYEQFREWATAEDGTRVPISLVCRRGTPRDGTAPANLYGYGSYETSIDPWFSIPRLSLVDRGFVFAVAHVRGGGEMGRRWYEDGKLLRKKNTFTDFVACAAHLAKTGWTSPDRLIARGGSAGGLLMGAIANLAPDHFAGIVAQVPFVDALNTILDPSLPLTVTEWEEWGNPLESPEVYAYMKSYTPYENVEAKPYPPILAMAGINDTRVLYHEPAKWIARLRALAPGGDYLLKTEMGAGHGGPSGRYDAWREESFVLAWTLTQTPTRT